MKPILFWVGLVMSVGLSAKEKAVRSFESLQKYLTKAPYSVVMFYNKNKANLKNPKVKQQIKDIETMFQAVSKDPIYKDADLQFLTADLNRDKLRMATSQYSLNILPKFMLFLGRQPLNTPLASGLSSGYLYRTQLEALINSYLDKHMEKYLNEKAQARKVELEKAKIRAYNRAAYGPWYGSFYGPYGYPYWWYGHPYGLRPYWGFYW